MKVVIAGSRGIEDTDIVRRGVEQFEATYGKITEIVSGTAKGVDKLGEGYALTHNVDLIRFPADWDKYGKAAGPIRNGQMAEYADAALIIWDGTSKGTLNMIAQMENAKKPYHTIVYMDFGYDVFEHGISVLVQDIKQQGHHFDYIVGLSRGGLIPATVLSHKLGIPMVPIEWSVGKKVRNTFIAQELFKGKRVLIVDDIVDSGVVIQSLIQDWQEQAKDLDWQTGIVDPVLLLADIEVAALIANHKQSIVQVDYVYAPIDREAMNDWVHFWWEQR